MSEYPILLPDEGEYENFSGFGEMYHAWSLYIGDQQSHTNAKMLGNFDEFCDGREVGKIHYNNFVGKRVL